MGTVNLLDMLNNLKPDEMGVDTTLAEQYLESNKAGFHGSDHGKESQHMLDSYGNILHNPVLVSNLNYVQVEPSIREMRIKLPEKFRNLAVEIENNTALFCHLEFLIRKISYNETKHSIKLITKNMLFASENNEKCDMQDSIIITDETPLFILGCVVQILLTNKMPTIIASKEVAVICYLFHKLCLKVGWHNRLIFGKDIQEIKDVRHYKVFPHLFDGRLPEITGVITENSDLDSAVDVFLNSDHHPFPVTRIFVQENIYEELKTSMAWKCKSNQVTTTKGTEEIKLMCSNAFEYQNKLFILDFAGNLGEKAKTKQIILVEAYRTVAEVISLLNKSRQRLCLSLWSNSISEANQIAISAKVPLVWINDCCNFNGPTEISQGIYKRIDFNVYVNDIWYNNLTVKQLKEKQKPWLQKTYTERCKIILKGTKDEHFAFDIESEIAHWKINNFITNDNNVLLQGFNEPIDDVIGFYNPFIDDIIKALINGNAVVAREVDNSNISKCIESLIAMEEIPIMLHRDDQDGEDKGSRISFKCGNWLNQTKVIWTNFGTTFAN